MGLNALDLKICRAEVPSPGTEETSLTRNHEFADSIPGLAK